MADISLICPECGKTTKVSEYISKKIIHCNSCGHELPIPEQKKPAIRIGLKKREKPEETDIPIESATIDKQTSVVPSHARKVSFQSRDRQRVKINTFMLTVSWVVFVLLAAALAYIRFYNGWPGVPMEDIKQYGLIALGISYLVIIILAIKDNMFDGLLCIIVPMYPFYYLFMVAGHVYLRAVVGAILVMSGYDLTIFLQSGFNTFYDKVSYMIRNN